MKANMWTVAEAKAKFSEVVERAHRGTPQTIWPAPGLVDTRLS